MDQKTFSKITPANMRTLIAIQEGRDNADTLMGIGFMSKSAMYAQVGALRDLKILAPVSTARPEGQYVIQKGKKLTPEQVALGKEMTARRAPNAELRPGELPPELQRLELKLMHCLEDVRALAQRVCSPAEQAALTAMRGAGLRIGSKYMGGRRHPEKANGNGNAKGNGHA